MRSLTQLMQQQVLLLLFLNLNPFHHFLYYVSYHSIHWSIRVTFPESLHRGSYDFSFVFNQYHFDNCSIMTFLFLIQPAGLFSPQLSIFQVLILGAFLFLSHMLI